MYIMLFYSKHLCNKKETEMEQRRPGVLYDLLAKGQARYGL